MDKLIEQMQLKMDSGMYEGKTIVAHKDCIYAETTFPSECRQILILEWVCQNLLDGL